MQKRKTKYREKMNYIPRKKDQEKNEGVSMTIQGDTLSISEMLIRLSNGIPLTSKNGVYLDDLEEDHDNPDLEKLRDADIIDRSEAIEEANAIGELVKKAGEKKKKTPLKKDVDLEEEEEAEATQE